MKQKLIAAGTVIVVFSLAAAVIFSGWSTPVAANDGADGGAIADLACLSPTAIISDKDGQTLYVALATAGKVVAVDPVKLKPTGAQFAVAGSPSGLALSPDGGRIFVTLGEAAGQVEVLDIKSGKSAGKMAVGHTPMAPVVSPDGATLYVCNRFNNNVGVINLREGRQMDTIAVLREPDAAAITPDGKKLFVANLLATGTANVDYIAACVSMIELAGKKITHVALPNGSHSLRGLTVSPDGKHVYVTHILSRYQLPTTQLDRGWMNTNALSIIDAVSGKLINTVVLDNVDHGAANPWGVAVSADGKWICATHAGVHEVSIIDRAALHAKLDALGTKVVAAAPASMPAKGAKASEAVVVPKKEDMPNDMAFLVGLRNRVRLAAGLGVSPPPASGAPLAQGPRAIVVLGMKAYTADYYSDTISAVDFTAGQPVIKTAYIGAPPRESPARQGERLFNDARSCFQNWQSCATCHPDGRTDGLNWDLLNDGIGNPKQTKNMVWATKLPPAMSLGVRESAEYAIRTGFKFIQMMEPSEAECKLIEQYFYALKPTPSPYLVNGRLSESANRGAKVFEDAGCARCHPAPNFGDKSKHDVGTGLGSDIGAKFDTPTLVEIWRTAPYLYLGQAADIKEVLTKCNPKDEHGSTSKLTPQQIDDLVQYLLSQ